MKYLQVTICTNHEASDLISYLLIEAGSEGTAIKDSKDVAELTKSGVIWDYIDEKLLTEDERVYVSGFFDVNKDLRELYRSLDQLKTSFNCGSLEISSTVLDSSDYENEWKKYYKPIEIGKVVIVPKWIKREKDEHIEVLIDPGMAFGTGSHETTAMCIKLLDGLDLKGKRVCDFGCGSGILGITAVKMGAKRCIMSDIDRQAVQAATENAALNGVSDKVEILCGDLKSEGTFDVVVANITADVLIRLSGIIGGLLNDEGTLIVSGIINSRADEVLSAYGALKLEKKIRDGEWQAFAFRK